MAAVPELDSASLRRMIFNSPETPMKKKQDGHNRNVERNELNNNHLQTAVGLQKARPDATGWSAAAVQ